MMRNYVFSEITFVGIFVNEIHGEVEEETFEMEIYQRNEHCVRYGRAYVMMNFDESLFWLMVGLLN